MKRSFSIVWQSPVGRAALSFLGGMLVARAFVFAVLTLAGCYDPKSPNLPPCMPEEPWCYEHMGDAGRDAR